MMFADNKKIMLPASQNVNSYFGHENTSPSKRGRV